MQHRLPRQDKVAVIVGAAGGIGRAAARRFAALGYALVIADINQDALERIRCELLDISSRVIAMTVDVTAVCSWDNLRDRALREYHHVDVLINCAGVIAPEPVDNLTCQSLKRQIDGNLLGAILGVHTFLPHFRHRRTGHFICVASLGGIVPMPGEAVYSATKFAIRGFCLSAALELAGTPVRMSVVCPDSVDTPQLRHEAIHCGSPMSFLGSPLRPSDIARAIARVVRHPRIEVSVSAARGIFARLLSLSPGCLKLVYPVIRRLGNRGRQTYLAAIQYSAAAAAAREGHHD